MAWKGIVKEKYKNITFQGSTFPDDPYQIIPVKLNDTITKEYIPALDIALPDAPKGLKLLIIAMTHMEGFRKGTRSYRTNNPGNIGNTDSGANKPLKTLADGIKLQARFIEDIVAGKKKAYPMGKNMAIPPFYSPEIAKNPQYGLPPYLPGYRFKFTGQIDQFVKIYSTGARATNNYVDVILSLFKAGGLDIKPESKLHDIILMDEKETPLSTLGKIVGEIGAKILNE